MYFCVNPHLPLLPPWELDLVVQLEGLYPRPGVRSDGTTQLTDEGELLWLGVALHDRTSCPHLGHYATCSPEIYWWSIVTVPEEKFWGPVPQRHYSVCVPGEEFKHIYKKKIIYKINSVEESRRRAWRFHFSNFS